MSMTDPIADLLTRIRNAQMAAHESVEVPYSRIKHDIVRILAEEGYILTHSIDEAGPHRKIHLRLKYGAGRVPAIQVMKRVSKPGRRVYVRHDAIPSVLGGLGVNILTTSKGILTGKKARQESVGGEILCEVY